MDLKISLKSENGHFNFLKKKKKKKKNFLGYRHLAPYVAPGMPSAMWNQVTT